jgi:hypothetical protein|tara:strand:- start:2 stop:211 length:210 start_codon:yes stop_codon:yes gene_type:complete
MSYQVVITLDFEERPTDEDVHEACKAWADEMKNDYELLEPFEEPFDDPARRTLIIPDVIRPALKGRGYL